MQRTLLGRLAASLAALLILSGGAVAGAGSGSGSKADRYSPARLAATEPDAKTAVRVAARRRAELRTPRAKRARRRSRTAYRGKSKKLALRAAKRNYSELISEPIWEPPRLKPGDRIKEYTSDTSALVDVVGTDHDALVESIVPFSVEGASGERETIDLKLQRKGETYVPRKAAMKGSLPRALADGVVVGHKIRFTPAGAEDAAGAELLGDKALYANVAQDTDVLVGVLPHAIETFHFLRSPKSPEKHVLDLSLPKGASLERLKTGSVAIELDGEPLGTVGPVTAMDAQGQNVPVSYSIRGHQLTLDVEHRGLDLAYPLVVDPTFSEPWGSDYEAGIEFGGLWQFATNRPGLILSSLSGGWGEGPYVVMPRSSTAYNHGDYGQWYVRAPGTILITRTDWDDIRQAGQPSQQGGPACVSLGFQTGDRSQWLGTPHTYIPCAPFHDSHEEICGGNPPCAPNSMPTGNVVTFYSWMYGGGTRIDENYAFIDGAFVYEHDLDRPTFSNVTHSSRPTGWVESASESVTATAEDTGFGVKRMSMSRVGPGAAPDTRALSCIGNVWDRCPATWSSNSNYRNWTQTFNYTTAGFPDGENTIGLYAVDALGNPSTGAAGSPTHESHQWVVKVDRVAPDYEPNSPSGPLAPSTGWVSDPSPSLTVDLRDSNPNGGQVSGVKYSKIEFDPGSGPSETKSNRKPDDTGPPCDAQSGCKATLSHSLDWPTAQTGRTASGWAPRTLWVTRSSGRGA